MLLTTIHKYRLRLLLGFLPLFLIAAFLQVTGSVRTVQDTQNQKETVYFEQAGSTVNINLLSCSEKKVNAHFENLTVTSCNNEGDLQLIRSAIYRSLFNKKSVTNFRMHSFLSSHFSSST